MEIGETINSWTLLDRIVTPPNTAGRGLFQCKCGATHVRQVFNISSGKSEHCRACGRTKIEFTEGQKTNEWTFIRFVKPKFYAKATHSTAEFRCSCGKVCTLQANSVRIGLSKQCHDCAAKTPKSRKMKAGMKINRWTFVKYLAGDRSSYATFVCDCGYERRHQISNVVHGKTKMCRSCSTSKIMAIDFTDDLFSIWHKMLIDHKQVVTTKWQTDFKAFSKWARRSGFTGNQQLTRKDTTQDYSSFNCTFK